MNKNQKGFGLIESLLIILILAVVGFGGYYVWHSQHSKTQPAALSLANSKSATTQKYLDIKELGIKFALNSKINDAYYIKGTNGYYYFSVHSFDNNPDLSGCAAVEDSTGGTGLLALIVAKTGAPGEDPMNDPWTQDEIDSGVANGALKQVGDTYYGFQGGNGPCFDANASNADALAATVSDIKAAFDPSTFTKD